MKIVRIHEDKLLSIHYSNQLKNEFRRNLENWRNFEFIKDFVEKNYKDFPYKISKLDLILKLANRVQDIELELKNACSRPKNNLDMIFKPLFQQRDFKNPNLTLQKGKFSFFKLYAVKLESNCYLITGGAIKFTEKDQDRAHTNLELTKVSKCCDFLKDNHLSNKETVLEYFKIDL